MTLANRLSQCFHQWQCVSDVSDQKEGNMEIIRTVLRTQEY